MKDDASIILFSLCYTIFSIQSFGNKSDDFYAYTYQSRQIMEMMQLYVKMAYNDDKKSPEKKVSDNYYELSIL